MKSVDSAIRKTALDLNIPEDKVNVIVKEYWNEIYKKVVSGSVTAVTVRGVGTFALSRYKLNRLILNQIGKIKSIRKSKKFTEETKKLWIDIYYGRLRLALKHRNEIAIQYAKNFKNI